MAEVEAPAGGLKMKKKATPRFCRFFLDDPSDDWKLEIPEKFAADHGSQLPKKAILKIPNGAAEWPVRAWGRGGKMWFDEGWIDFAKFYSIGTRYFLVFEYRGNGHFLVLIFDTTATEIDYETRRGKVLVREEYGAGSIHETMGNSSPYPKAREKPRLIPQRPCKLRRRRTLNDDISAGEILEDESLKVRSDDPDQNHNGTSQKGKKLMAANGRADALARTKAEFQNPHFVMVMQSSYLPPRLKLYPPTRFLLEHFKDKLGEIALRLPNGKSWRVDYIIAGVTRNRAVFTVKSWGQFVRDNLLQIGDVCVFEVVKGGEPTLNVAIVRAQGGQIGSGPTEAKQRNLNSVSLGTESAGCKKDRSGNPRKRSNHDNQLPHSIRANEANQSNLNSVSLGTESAGCKEDRSGNPRKRSNHDNQLPHSIRANAAADAFTSSRPHFKVVVSRYHLSRNRVGIPFEFWKHIVEGTREAELQISGKCWGVRIFQRTSKAGWSSKTLGGGWKAFADCNSLKEGDICVYELIKGEDDHGGDACRKMIGTIQLSVRIVRS